MGARLSSVFLALLLILAGAAAFYRLSRPASPKKTVEGCSPDPGFDRTKIFKISGNIPDVQVSNALSTSEIEALDHRKNASSVRVPGLTSTEYSLKKNLSVSFSQSPGDERVCVWLDSLNIDFSYSKLDVYVAREYPAGTCPYAELLSHEGQHVAAYRQIHEEYIDKLKEAFQEASELPTQAKPIWAENKNQGEALVKRLADETAAPVMARLKEELAQRQAALDTPENYRQLQARCANWN